MRFTFMCIACEWSGEIEAKGFTEALHECQTRHMKEGGATEERCAGETFIIGRIIKKTGEGTYFTTCPECDWLAPVKANGPAMAKTLGTIKHNHEEKNCPCKEVEVKVTDEVVEEKFFG